MEPVTLCFDAVSAPVPFAPWQLAQWAWKAVFPATDVGRCRPAIARWICTIQNAGLPPSCDHSIHNDVHLLVGQHSPARLSKRVDGLQRFPAGDNRKHVFLACPRKVHRIVHRQRRAIQSAVSMTGGAIAFVENIEIDCLTWAQSFWTKARLAGQMIAPRRRQ